ncbi:hypothetical protein [Bradyrhizobium australiense]|uniref:Uncharacterized protein n=1 Tax=Bradyrhizobium australiense TaxID=2721161 RepID=A0A7Y4GTR9_9BRAD|nr:hypothetical protein [Bradyrhizobium australiense]NOJ41569.1 hypothetical protein [Bradyrhizobium australiense]
MQKLLLTISIVVIVILSVLLAVILQDPQISTVEIDRDRAILSAEISAIQTESAKYESGLIKSLIEVRLAITRNTLAMLDQKRTAFIRRVSLNYRLDSQPVHEASDQELKLIVDDLSQAERKANASKQEAARYSGGLLQAVALMKAETDEISVSQLRLKFYSAKHGIPIPLPNLSDNVKTPTQPPGKIVKDREAL